MDLTLKLLIDAEERYLKTAGWTCTIQRAGLPSLWRHPESGDEFAQPSAISEQKRRDGYLPRAWHQPISAL